MSGLRDILLLVIVIGLVPVSLARPWIGILAWSWIAYMTPHGLTWGFGRTLPVALLIGGATLVGLLFSKDRQPLPRVAGLLLLAWFAIHVTISTLLAYNPILAFAKWDWVIKSLLMTFVTMCLFQDRARLRWLYIVIALSLGFYGLKGGVWVLRTGGGERVFGPDMSFFSDNNTLGLALCMVLPLLLYLSREEPRRWLKQLLRVIFGFTIIAIVFTYSRGAFLGLAVVLSILIWRSPHRLRFAAALVLAGLIAIPLIPGRLEERIASITAQDSSRTRDESTIGRLEAWQTGLNLALTHPFFGGGFRVYWNDDVWQQYHVGEYLAARDAHSIYFEVLGEQGFVGLSLYLAIFINTLVALKRIRARWRGHPVHGYLSHYAEMIQLSFYPFMVSGAFLGVAYFDLYFHLVSTGIILQVLSARAAGQPKPPDAPPPRRVETKLAAARQRRQITRPRARHA